MLEKRRIIKTKDGSSSLFDPQTGDNFHSFHGAETESQYVFIEKGLIPLISRKSIRIFEVGLGTALNLCLTYKSLSEIDKKDQKVHYHSIEAIPVESEMAMDLSFSFRNTKAFESLFNHVHHSEWDVNQEFDEKFSYCKTHNTLESYDIPGEYDLIFFDAFGPTYQPDLWQWEVIKKVCDALAKGGILVTYCAQGQFRRHLEKAGLVVERLPGPPGKRQMIRAQKPF